MTGQERRAVSSLALLYAFRMLGLFMVLPLLAVYAVDVPGATPTLIGLALGIYGLSQALLQIPLGWLSDRVGRKPVIIGGLALFALGSVIAAMSDSIYGIVAGRFLQGAGAIASTVMALVADLTSTQQRTKAMALVGISIGVSFALALVVGPLLASVAGLAGVFAFTALLGGIGIVIVLALVPSPVASDGADAALARASQLGTAVREPRLARLNLGVFVLHFTLMACFLVVPGALESLAGIERDGHWLVYLPVLAASVIAMVPLMIMAERNQRLRLAYLTSIALVACGAGLLGLQLAPSVLIVGLWLFFIGFNYLEATLPSLVSKTVAENGRGTAMGVFSTCQFLGAFLGGAVGGWLLEHAGVSGLTFACLALCGSWWVVTLRSRAPLVAPDSATSPGSPG